MHGSETALEELMSRVLGDLIMEGKVAKLADDLYIGGNSIQEVKDSWRSVLNALSLCNLKLSPSKTVVCPRSTTILGWIWTEGELSASKHRIATLSACTQPEKAKGLRSFIGAYKVLSRVIKGCSRFLSPLEVAVAGKSSTDSIEWTDKLQKSFSDAKAQLAKNSSITLPKNNDQLWIVTDGAVRDPGVGATLYVTREKGKPLLAGFFSAKLRKHQPSWLPCEIEALSIAAAIKHFSPYIIQSNSTTCVLTDSKPCVQAYEKLCRGNFSNSSRLTTFLSTASNYQVSIRHLSGTANLPSDFSSRNAPSCSDPKCQICLFVNEIESSVVVNAVSVSDIVSGIVKLPFTTRSTWITTQSECPDIRRAIAQLKQGTRPSKKQTTIKDVKRYLRYCSVSRDNLLVVKREEPFVPVSERIVVPRSSLIGLLTALHVKLDHPKIHQMKQVFSRYFFALDMDSAIEKVSESCHLCASLKQVNPKPVEQSTSDPPSCIGINFATDVIRRYRQFILVLRETVTSFTCATFVLDEKAKSLREGLLKLLLPIHPVDSPTAIVRTDPAPGFQALVDDPMCLSYGFKIDVGEAKNINKNPVAEKCVQEVEKELLRLDPTGGPVSEVMLSAAISRLNTRIRSRGFSAHEMLFQREQFSNTQLNTPDGYLIKEQHSSRLASHGKQNPVNSSQEINVGSIVYLRSEGSKTNARPRYLVVKMENSYCFLRKFTENQFRSKLYKVRLSDCFCVQNDYKLSDHIEIFSDSEEGYDTQNTTLENDNDAPLCSNENHVSFALPTVPQEISDPYFEKDNSSKRRIKIPKYLESYQHEVKETERK